MVTGTMVADGPDKTEVTMATDLTITGKPTQFGRGVIADVADKIVGRSPAASPTGSAEARTTRPKRQLQHHQRRRPRSTCSTRPGLRW
ncbi:hypothetical protein [Amycolatopsis nalaikhensis]|uniref:hypothetical protein n=1 Tax=Amycolatopsis nalaikhensis TaxID=715472 RepID=UPI003333F25E